MLKKWNLWIFGLLGVIFVSGCSTGRSYQSDMDSLNAKISALQGQMTAKDEELARLRSETGAANSAQREQLARTEEENHALNERLNAALAKLDAERAAAKKAQKPTAPKQDDSDLK